MARVLGALTIKRLYIGLFAATFLVVALWALCDARWVETWAPNVAAELGGALITVGLVDLILRRQRRPLARIAAQRIRAVLENLLEVVVTHRLRMNPHVEETHDVEKFFRDWQRELESGLPERDWLRYWSQTIAATQSIVASIRDRYDRVLDDALLAALDDFELWVSRAANDVNWLVTLDNAVRSRYPTPTWTPSFLAHFKAAFEKIIEIARHYERQFGEHIAISDEIWRDARVVAGPRMSPPEADA